MEKLTSKCDFIREVIALKQSNIDTYKQPKRITADYRMEKATTKSYNGRQILELLQNCDDALLGYENGDCEINIQLDSNNNILRVSNYGTPFNVDGIGSLLIANTSNKGREFIGNKGLGFRSVLNWVNEIKLYTQGCVISFSKHIAEKSFRELVSTNDQQALIKDNREHLENGEVPIAVLSMPVIEENIERERYSTTVELHYLKEKEEDIKLQLEKLNTKLLLFLNHIRNIKVEYVVENKFHEIRINEEQSTDTKIVTNNGSWNYKDSGDIYFDKIEDNERYYRIKLAWKDDLSDEKSRFYTYFPTAVPTNLPFLIHATFDLDPTRNYLNTSNNGENQTILRNIALLMKETALLQLCINPVNWQAYIFLLPINQNTNELLDEFYNLLQEYSETEAIYPCVNNTYVNIDNAVFHGDEFSKWVLDNNLGSFFPRLLKPKNNINVDVEGRYRFEEWENIIEEINQHLSIELRTELIGLLIKGSNSNDFFKEIHESERKLPLLLDNDENGKVVKASMQVFTKDTEDISYKLPSYIDDIAFISTTLYNEIKQKLSNEIEKAKLDTETGPSRAIKRLLSKVVNIGSDDIIDVIDLIVKQTNQKLEVTENKLDTVNEMLLTLFSIFLSNPDRRGKLTSIKAIPIITRNLTVKFANELFFGKEYNSGKETEFIFEGVYDDGKYIAGADILGLDLENSEFFESFFLWLGVNEDIILERVKREEKWRSWDYANFVREHTILPEKVTYYSCENFFKLSNIEDIQKLDIYKLFRLLVKNHQLFELILGNADFYTKYGNEYKKPAYNAPNYIVFQLASSFNFNNYIINENLPKNLGLLQIELDDTLNNDIEHKQMLLAKKLGVKTSFNKLSIDTIINAISLFGELDENASNSQEFYKLLNEYFKANEERLRDWKLDTAGIKYFSRLGGIGRTLKAIDAENVYYSDNKLLPQTILDKYWFINLPKRIGENQIRRFFGIKLIKDVISDTKVNISKTSKLNTDFGNYLNSLKPYLLCYRLQSLKQNQNKKNEANLIKPIAIKLVTKATIEFDKKTPIELENYDFLPEGNTFILKYGEETSIESLQQDALFCDAIAEMCCIIFKVQDLKNTFRRIFKDGIKEAAHLIKTDELDEYLMEAKKLLGVSIEEQQFWKKIFPNVLNTEISEENKFRKNVQLILNTTLPEYYSKIDFSNLGNHYGIEFLKWLSIQVNPDLHTLICENTLSIWHKENLKNHLRDYSKVFEYSLWKQANNSNNLKLKEEFFNQSIVFEEAVNLEKFSHFLIENQYNLSPDYQLAVQDFAKGEFNVSLNGTTESFTDISNNYIEIFKKYRFGHSVEDMENILKSEKPLIHSLIFFEGYTETIKQTLDELELQNKILIEDEELDKIDELIIVHSALTKATPKNTGNQKSSSSHSHNSKGDRKKTIAGKRIEKRVFKALTNQGYDVRNIAQKRDSKHYDLEYKKKNHDTWRYLEVKKDSGGFFFLSKAEKETAIKKENNEKYDI
ncbi:MAG: sacsin N-terminal ATP-binding-like domain-containing protein, partial [Bacteroidales bacterium]